MQFAALMCVLGLVLVAGCPVVDEGATSASGDGRRGAATGGTTQVGNSSGSGTANVGDGSNSNGDDVGPSSDPSDSDDDTGGTDGGGSDDGTGDGSGSDLGGSDGDGTGPGTDPASGVYGSGRSGSVVIEDDGDLALLFEGVTSGFQFVDLTINDGVSVSVPGGAVIRCTGTFVNRGTLIVQAAQRGGSLGSNPELGLAATRPTIGTSGIAGSSNVSAGLGGSPASASARNAALLYPGSKGGGGGAASGANGTGGAGGGTLVVLAKNSIRIEGAILADGAGGLRGGGGGGGGVILLGSSGQITRTASAVLSAEGGAGSGGGGLLGTAACPGSGGGGGGAIRIIAPTLVNAGSASVRGGAAGVASTASFSVGTTLFGAGGGGASVGQGGNAGASQVSGVLSNTFTALLQAGQDGQVGMIELLAQDAADLF